MLELSDIKAQTYLESDQVTQEAATKTVTAERWAPHVPDGLDAFGTAIFEAEAKKWAEVIAKASTDAVFRERLLADPTSTLKAFGIAAQAGVELRLVEATEKVKYVVLPASAMDGAAKPCEREVATLASSAALATRSTRLPQTWADTWEARD